MRANLFSLGSTRSRDRIAGLAAMVALGLGGAAIAAAPQTEEAAKYAPPKTEPPPCASGEPRDDSGACPVIDDAPATRGFELFPGPMPPHGVRPPVVAADSSPPAAAPSGPCGVACDLKITFRPGSATLSRAASDRLDQFVKMIGAPDMAGKHLEIAGHTDASGSPARNKALSLARAEAVIAYLEAHGVPAERLTAKGYGSEGLLLPKVPRDPRNRRVEARVLD